MAKATGKRLFEITLASRSDAYQWLRRNHSEIAEVIAAYGRPSWVAVKKVAEDDGHAFSTNALRKAWERLQRDLGREVARQHEKPASPEVREPPKSTQPAPGTSVGDDDDEEEIEITMGDGTPRKIKVPKQR